VIRHGIASPPAEMHRAEDKPMTTETMKARPLMGFQLVQNPDQPTVPILAMKTVEGVVAFLVTADILRQLAREFERAAASIPRKADQN